jgi:DNA recombination protein Rad52
MGRRLMAIYRDLAAPLDPRRVQTRKGGGGKNLSYLTTHDVKRTANRIFGFDGWSYVVNELTSLGEEQTKPRTELSTPGVRVGYRAVVTVTVAGTQRGDVGYGDAMEYNGSRITPHELAAKEAVSDALKRCLSSFGDQFGLVLYGEDPAPLDDELASESPRSVSARPARAPKAPSNASAPPTGDEHTRVHAQAATSDLKLPPEAKGVISAAQVKKMWTMARGYGLSDAMVKEIVVNVGGVESSKLIPRAKFEQVLKEIELTGKGVQA